MRKISTLFAYLLLAISASAAWVPGLRFGSAAGNSLDIAVPEEEMNTIVLSPHMAVAPKADWSGGTTGKVFEYTGEIFLEGGVTYRIASSVDDGVRMWIGDDTTPILNDGNWNRVDCVNVTKETSGWYSFRLRFQNGGGGGPVATTNGGWNWASTFGFGISTTSDSSKNSADFFFPVDDGTMNLFRCDDGNGFDDELLIKSNINALGSPAPACGAIKELSAGSEVTCSMPETSHVAEDGSWRATLVGYTVSNFVNGTFVEVETHRDGSSSYTHVHGSCPTILTWLWQREYRLSLSSDDATASFTVNDNTYNTPIYLSEGSSVTITTTATKSFSCWLGNISNDNILSNPLSLTIDKGYTLSAIFGAQNIYLNSSSGLDSNIGFFPDRAVKTIDRAMQLAQNGSTIHLAPGAYPLSSNLIIERGITFLGTGLTPADTEITASSLKRVILNHPDAKLVNLQVANGKLNGTHSNVAQNTNRDNGANICIDEMGGTVSNCVIKSGTLNYHSYGAGAFIGSENGLIIDSTFIDNIMTDANTFGGNALAMTKGRVERCLFVGNRDSVTAAFQNTDSHKSKLCTARVFGGTIDHCTFAFNTSFGSVITLSGGTVANSVFAKNDSIALSQDVIFETGTDEKTISNCVCDTALLSDDSVMGEIFFRDITVNDFRLAANSAGVVTGGIDPGYAEAPESSPVTITEPETITLNPGDDIPSAIRLLKNGGKILLNPGDYPVTGLPVTISRNIELRGTGSSPNDVRFIKGNETLLGPLVAMIGQGPKVCNLSFCENKENTGNNQSGNGLYVRGAQSIVSNCLFYNIKLVSNGHSGIAMRVRGSDAHITQCVFSNIVAHANTTLGGALAVDTGLQNVIVDNSLFVKCTTDTFGTGDSAGHSSRVNAAAAYIGSGLFINNTIAKCGASTCAGVMVAGTAQIKNCLFFGNESTHSSFGGNYANFTGGAEKFSRCVSDTGAINEDCLLASSATLRLKDFAASDFTFDSKSIAVDVAPKPLPEGVSRTDLNGNPRVIGRGIDAGCFENQVKKLTMLILR